MALEMTMLGRIAAPVHDAVRRLAAQAQDADKLAPKRVVSFNLCADQLVLALADPSQIAGLSPYAADPSLVGRGRQGARLPQARLAGRIHHRAAAGSGLRRTQRPLDDAAHAELAGPARGRGGLVSDLDWRARADPRDGGSCSDTRSAARSCSPTLSARGRGLRAVPARRRPRSSSNGGYTQGPASLAATLLSEAGLKPPAGAPAGYGGFIPLEKFLVLKPDLVFC